MDENLGSQGLENLGSQGLEESNKNKKNSKFYEKFKNGLLDDTKMLSRIQ